MVFIGMVLGMPGTSSNHIKVNENAAPAKTNHNPVSKSVLGITREPSTE